MNNKSNSKFITEYFQIILQHIFDNIGEKNIISVIVTGSVARNQELYRKINEQLFLESDIDLLIVVKRRAILKALMQNKKLSEILTKKFQNMQILSHVSLSIASQKSLLQSIPSIFYNDLIQNGNIIYGKDICKALPRYEINEIPNSDISKLLFNRMIESMELVLPIIYLKTKSEELDFSLSLSSIRKFIFTMIQAILIKENILLYNFSELITLKNQRLDYLTSIIPNDLLLIFDEVNGILESQKSISKEYLETLWLKTIIQFDMTFFRISNVEISSQTIFDIMSDNSGFTKRVKISIFLFLEYLPIKKSSEVIQTMIYSLIHNPVRIYMELYKFFKSSSSGIGSETGSSKSENSKNEGINKNEKIFRLDDFQKYLQIWKMMYS